MLMYTVRPFVPSAKKPSLTISDGHILLCEKGTQVIASWHQKL